MGLVRYPHGSGTKVEVKSAAYVQTWEQKRESVSQFDIRPTHATDGGNTVATPIRSRQAHVYVFCVLHHRDRSTIDALDLAHWEFYVLPAAVLNRHHRLQKTIALSSLLKLGPRKAAYADLAVAVETIG